MTLPHWSADDNGARRLLFARCAGRSVALFIIDGPEPRGVDDALARGRWVSPELDPNRPAAEPGSLDDLFASSGVGMVCHEHAEHDLSAVNMTSELRKALRKPLSTERAARNVYLRSRALVTV